MDLLSAERQLEESLKELKEKQSVNANELNALLSVKNKLSSLIGDKCYSRRKDHASKNPPFKLTEPLLSETTYEEVNAQLSRFASTLVSRLKETDQLFKSSILKQSASHEDLNKIIISVFQTLFPVDKVCILFRNTRFGSFNFSEFSVGKGEIGPSFATLENALNELEGELCFLEIEPTLRQALNGQLQFHNPESLYGCVQVTLPELSEYTETKAIFLFVSQKDCKQVLLNLYESEVLKSFVKTVHLSLVKLLFDFSNNRLNRETLSYRSSRIRNLLSVSGVLLLDFAISASIDSKFSLRWRDIKGTNNGVSVISLTDTEWEIVMLTNDSRKDEGNALVNKTFQQFLCWLREECCASVDSLWTPDSLFLMQMSQIGVVEHIKLAEEQGVIVKQVIPEFQPDKSIYSYLDHKVARLVEEAISDKLLSVEAKRETIVMFSQVKYKVGWLSPIDGHSVSEGAHFYVLAATSLNTEKRGSVKIALNLAEELA